MDSNLFVMGITWYLVFVMSSTLHEAAHAYVAMKLGDLTAYHGGQVTLNPMPHIEREPFGMVLVPILCFFLGGYMMGWASAPYNPHWAYRYPKKAGLMALAGPMANLFLVIISGILIRWGYTSGFFAESTAFTNAVYQTLRVFFLLNVILFTFNLIPVPPLDGSSILQLFMPEDTSRRYQDIMRDPTYALAGILFAWIIYGSIVGGIIEFAVSVFFGK